MEPKVSVYAITVTSGGVEVYLDAEPDQVGHLVDSGRKMAMDEAQKRQYAVNSLSSEAGPFAVDRETGLMLFDGKNAEQGQMSIKAAMEAKRLIYRKKFVLTFIGG
jgi:hypothetical protein